MTLTAPLARVIGASSTGSGTISFRLTIEGFPYEFVTHADMVRGVVDGRERIDGLSVVGVKLSQKADLVNATIDATGASFKISDIDDRVTEAFSTAPTLETWLEVEVSPTDTTFIVKSTTGWPSEGVFWIDSEAVRYWVDDVATFGAFDRGYLETLAQSHFIPDGGSLRYVAITNRPTSLDGRRVRLYAYAEGDDMQGDGSPLSLGIMVGEPRMEGPSWTILVDPISRVLEQEVGSDLGEEVQPRGIYYPGTPDVATTWLLWCARNPLGGDLPESRAAGSPSSISADEFTISMVGFWESQTAFLQDLNTKLTDATSSRGWTTVITAEDRDDGTWQLRLDVASPAEGVNLHLRGIPNEIELTNNAFQEDPGAFDPVGYSTMTAGETYYWRHDSTRAGMADRGTVPRGMWRLRSPALTYPNERVYLGGVVGIPDNTYLVLIEFPSGLEVQCGITALDAGDRYVDLFGSTLGGYDSAANDPQYYTASSLPTLRLGREYNSAAYFGTGTYDLLATLTDEAPLYLNTGATPMIQAGDWNAADWLALYASASALASQRAYNSLEPAKLIDYIAPDLQLGCFYLAFDVEGRLTIRRLALASPTDLATFHITTDNLKTDQGFPTYEPGAAGSWNTLAVADGYDPKTGDYELPSIVVRNVAAHGRNPQGRTIRIEPKSISIVGTPLADVVAVADKTLGIFGGPYAYVTVTVPLTAFEVLLGDTVSITTPHLPSSTGERGVTQLMGLVTARELDLYGARIVLTVLVSQARIAGYAPSSLMSGITSLGSNQYTATLSSDYLVAGDSWSNHFVPTDRISVFRYDSLTPGTIIGTVTNMVGSTVSLTLDSALTVGSDEWLISHADADEGGDAANQRRYCVQAEADGLLAWSVGGNAPAFQFGP